MPKRVPRSDSSRSNPDYTLHSEEPPIAAKYVRPFIGADELIKGKDRWCLWLVDAPQSDLSQSLVLAERLAQVRDMRSNSTKEPTRRQASTPHLFTEIRQPHEAYLCIPSLVTSNRDYFTAARMEADVITSNLAFTAQDKDGFLFALISSSMFITWQRLVGGRMKSDLRFSNTIVWNNFPLGEATTDEKRSIITAGQEVIRVRTKYKGSSLESLYDPKNMPQDLREAHIALDIILENQLGVPEGATELDRQRLLLERYAKLTTGKVTGKRVSRR